MSTHTYFYDKATDSHVCTPCGRVKPVPSSSDLDTANIAFDAARDLERALGVSISVQSLQYPKLGLHAAVRVSTEQGYALAIVDQNERIYFVLNGSLVDEIPASFRKFHAAWNQISAARLAEWVRAQLLRYPEDAECAPVIEDATPLQVAETVNATLARTNPTEDVVLTTDSGHECHFTLTHSIQGIRAQSFAFAPDSADIVSETRDTLYMDYCQNEILYLELAKLLPDQDASDLWDELEAQGLVCECADDEVGEVSFCDGHQITGQGQDDAEYSE